MRTSTGGERLGGPWTSDEPTRTTFRGSTVRDDAACDDDERVDHRTRGEDEAEVAGACPDSARTANASAMCPTASPNVEIVGRAEKSSLNGRSASGPRRSRSGVDTGLRVVARRSMSERTP